jgi:formamidopyrimidine-DNA glycosylase
MPSLPELEVYRRELGPKIVGRVVTDVEPLDYRVVRADVDMMQRELVGRTLSAIRRYGKWLMLSTGEPPELVLHLGLTGKLKVVAEGDKLPGYARFALVIEGGDRLVMSDQRKLGKVYWRNFEEIKAEKKLGPDQLDMSEVEFVKSLTRRKRARDGLMDQKKIAGIGGKYADEILWQAKLHPNVRLQTLDDDKRRELYRLAKDITETAIELGANVERFPSNWLIPHRRTDKICPRCGEPLAARDLGGSATVYCPVCQPPPDPYAR